MKLAHLKKSDPVKDTIDDLKKGLIVVVELTSNYKSQLIPPRTFHFVVTVKKTNMFFSGEVYHRIIILNILVTICSFDSVFILYSYLTIYPDVRDWMLKSGLHKHKEQLLRVWFYRDRLWLCCIYFQQVTLISKNFLRPFLLLAPYRC